MFFYKYSNSETYIEKYEDMYYNIYGPCCVYLSTEKFSLNYVRRNSEIERYIYIYYWLGIHCNNLNYTTCYMWTITFEKRQILGIFVFFKNNIPIMTSIVNLYTCIHVQLNVKKGDKINKQDRLKKIEGRSHRIEILQQLLH